MLILVPRAYSVPILGDVALKNAEFLTTSGSVTVVII